MTMPDSVSGVAGKPRDVNYDLLRVVAMCLVIGVHVINNYMPVKMTLAGSAEVTRSVLFALFMVCNPLFIMVSGRFNLTFDADRPVSTHSAGRLRALALMPGQAAVRAKPIPVASRRTRATTTNALSR